MSEYFFLTTLFPEVDPDVPLEISVRELLVLFKDNLSEKDWLQVVILLREVDLNNLRAFLLDKPFDMRGSLSKEDLQETLSGNNGLPDYVHSFFERYEKKEERLLRFEELLASYYREESTLDHKKSFLIEWLEFERKLRLTLAAMRAKKGGKSLSEIFLFENPEDDFVQFLLAQKDAQEIEPEEPFYELIHIMKENDPLIVAKKLLNFRLEALRNMIGFDQFSMRRVLGFFIEVFLIENWQNLDKIKGKEILTTLTNLKT